jgi:hypothetical protein
MPLLSFMLYPKCPKTHSELIIPCQLATIVCFYSTLSLMFCTCASKLTHFASGLTWTTQSWIRVRHPEFRMLHSWIRIRYLGIIMTNVRSGYVILSLGYRILSYLRWKVIRQRGKVGHLCLNRPNSVETSSCSAKKWKHAWIQLALIYDCCIKEIWLEKLLKFGLV